MAGNIQLPSLEQATWLALGNIIGQRADLLIIDDPFEPLDKATGKELDDWAALAGVAR